MQNVHLTRDRPFFGRQVGSADCTGGDASVRIPATGSVLLRLPPALSKSMAVAMDGLQMPVHAMQ